MMSLYHYKIYNHLDCVDDVLIEYPNVHAAMSEALRTAGQMLSDAAMTPAAASGLRIDVFDNVGALVLGLHVAVTQAGTFDSLTDRKGCVDRHAGTIQRARNPLPILA